MIIAGPIDISIPAPTACTTLAIIRMIIVGDIAQKREPAVNIISPVLKIILCPKRSPSLPKVNKRLVMIIRYERITHSTVVRLALKYVLISGREILTMLESSALMNAPIDTTTIIWTILDFECFTSWITDFSLPSV